MSLLVDFPVRPVDPVDVSLGCLIVAYCNADARRPTTCRWLVRLFCDPSMLPVIERFQALSQHIPDADVRANFLSMCDTCDTSFDAFFDLFSLFSECLHGKKLLGDSVFGRHLRRLVLFPQEADLAAMCNLHDAMLAYMGGSSLPAPDASVTSWRYALWTDGIMLDLKTGAFPRNDPDLQGSDSASQLASCVGLVQKIASSRNPHDFVLALLHAERRSFSKAEQALRRVFDLRAAETAQGTLEFCMACLHADFGHSGEARNFLQQCISLAQEHNQDALLAECNRLAVEWKSRGLSLH